MRNSMASGSSIWKGLWSHTLLAAVYNEKTEILPHLLEKGAHIDFTRHADAMLWDTQL